MIGLGIDVVEIARIGRAASREAFLLRVYTEQERGYAASCGNRAETYAGMFAAKEAVAKALGTGVSGFGLRDVEIVHDAQGQPSVRLHGGAAERMQALSGSRFFLSITHSAGIAAAEAILEG